MTDPIEAGFADLDERYPGSRHNRRALESVPTTAREPVVWDNRPYSKVIGGKPVELFTIGALAVALERPLVTLRLWTRTGRLPQAIYRLPTRQVPVYATDGSVASYKEQKGRRLYTRAQIEAVIRIMSAHGILHAPRIEWTEHQGFALEVADAWQQLAT